MIKDQIQYCKNTFCTLELQVLGEQNWKATVKFGITYKICPKDEEFLCMLKNKSLRKCLMMGNNEAYSDIKCTEFQKSIQMGKKEPFEPFNVRH